MKFVLLFYLDEKRWAGLPDSELEILWAECGVLSQDLATNGQGGDRAALHPSSTATTLRLEGGRQLITDGPFAETKEMLVGYQVVDCPNLDEALEVAARFPPLRVGASVEVRPMMNERVHAK